MLSHTAADIATAGIMFATPFPTLPDAEGNNGTPGAHEYLSYSFPVEDFPGWMLVAVDPTRYSYPFDEEAQAMDETNWDVIIGTVGDYATEVNYGGSIGMAAEGWRRNVADAHDFGAFLVDGVLLVAPVTDESPADHAERVAALESASDSLVDYPFLDEEAYSVRESDAWNEYAERGGLEQDTTRDMSDAGMPDETVEAVADAWADVWPVACEHLHYYNGFTGEHGPDFVECVGKAIVGGLMRFVSFGAAPGWYPRSY